MIAKKSIKKRPHLRQSESARKGIDLQKKTDLHNRSWFDSVLGQEINKIRKYWRGFTLIRVDLDSVKGIGNTNDHLHAHGVLGEFTVLLGNSIRPSDLLITYGEDKFLLVVQGTSDMENNVLIERMTRNIMKWNKEHVDECQISFSYGIGIFDGTKDLRAVIGEADSQMHKKEPNRS